MEEDRRRLAEFERTRMGVPWGEVKAWVEIGRKPNALPIPQPTNYEARCLAGGSLEVHAIKYQNQSCAGSDDPYSRMERLTFVLVLADDFRQDDRSVLADLKISI